MLTHHLDSHRVARSIWQRVFQTSWQTRLVRIAWTASGYSLEQWGSDIASVDAFAVTATFGELCRQKCAGVTNFMSVDAGVAYEHATVDNILDLLRSSVLMTEKLWVELRGRAHNAGQGKPLFAYTSGLLPSILPRPCIYLPSPRVATDFRAWWLIPFGALFASGMDVHARDYGWRSTWDTLFEPPYGCQSCLYARSCSFADSLCTVQQQERITLVSVLHRSQISQ